MKDYKAMQGESAESILKKGFDNAVRSIALMTGLNVSYELLVSRVIEKDYLTLINDKDGDFTLLRTDLIGEIGGTSFFILDQRERDFFSYHRKTHNRQMNEAFIKEMDNIISAGMISRIASHLNCKVFGDVPNLSCTSEEELSNAIRVTIDQFDQCYLSGAKIIITEDPSVIPLFLWVLGDQFVRRAEIKGYSVIDELGCK